MVKKELKNFIRALKEDEFKEFRLFLESKFFKITNRDRVLKLYDYLIKKVWPDFTEEALDNDLLNKKLKITNSRNLKSNLIDALTEYFTYKNLIEQELHRKLIELNAYRTRGMIEEFKKFFDRYDSSGYDPQFKHIENNFYKFYAFKEQVEYNPQKESSAYAKQIEKFLKYFDEFYMTHKTIIEIQNIRENRRSGISFRNSMISEIIQETGNEIYKDNLYLDIFREFYFFELNRDAEPISRENYTRIKSRCLDPLNQLNSDDQHDMFVMLASMSLFRYAKDPSEINLRDLFDIYQIGCNKNVYLTGDHFNPIIYKNIINTARLLNESEWLEEFIDQYANKVPSAFINDARNFGSASICLVKGKYDDGIQHLAFMDQTTKVYNIASRVLLSQLYYNKNEFLLLDDYLNSFSKFLKRHSEITASHKSQYNKYIYYLKKIVGYHLKRNTNIISVAKELKNDTGVNNIFWLQEIINSLLPKSS